MLIFVLICNISAAFKPRSALKHNKSQYKFSLYDRCPILNFPPQPVRKTEAADPDRQPKARAKLKKDGNKQKIACNLIKNVIKSNSCAEMAEWSNAHDSKSCYVGTRTGVRIPLSAPHKNNPNLGPISVGRAFGFFYILSPRGNFRCPAGLILSK